jgi:hypothetical protein
MWSAASTRRARPALDISLLGLPRPVSDNDKTAAAGFASYCNIGVSSHWVLRRMTASQPAAGMVLLHIFPRTINMRDDLLLLAMISACVSPSLFLGRAGFDDTYIPFRMGRILGGIGRQKRFTASLDM